MQEIFKDIEGYNGVYQVSNFGNVKSYNKYKNGKILIPYNISSGYLMVQLRGDINKSYLIHRLVAKTFILNPENKREVNHINGDKTDNRLENLEWATPSENMQHALRTGLKKRGKDDQRSMPVVQLTLENIIVGKYAGAREASRQTGARQSGISKCCNGISKTAFGFKWQYKI